MPNDEPDAPLRSAEEWLAQRGVERHALIVRTDEPVVEQFDDDVPDDDDSASSALAPASLGVTETDVAQPDVTEPRAIESARVAEAAANDRAYVDDLEAAEPKQQANLSDDVALAMAYIRNATARTPMSSGRLRGRLQDREFLDPVIDLALQQATKERLIDDRAFASALVDESLAKGLAPRRIRDDLFKRGFERALVFEVLARTESSDPEAAAFAVARDRADSLSGLQPDTAYRRLVAYLARRGYGEGLARKVARQVLWVEREQVQTSTR